MQNVGYTGADYQAAFERLGSNRKVAEEYGVNESTVRRARNQYLRREGLDPGIKAALANTGVSPEIARGGWRRIKNENGSFDTVQWRMPDGDEVDFRATIKETLEEITSGMKLDLPKKFEEKVGNLLVLDPADVHIGKLSVASETGYTYDEHVAEHRLVEGSRMLMEWGLREGVTRVLFVMGNDIAHIDTPKRTTTSGTPQDASASYFEIYRVAQRAYVKITKMALDMGLHISLMHVPSNHDWTLGFCIANAVGLLMGEHENVTASDYMLSEMHRKYYRFCSNLLGFTHGDGVRESELGAVMRVEARSHISECHHLYWYLHHYHHKMKKSLGVRSQNREKDHTDMTVVSCGAGAMEGDNVQIEYVRSPSDPDGWHHRNGYLNRQAVEAFIHHPHDGQVLRKTEWF